MRPGIPHDLVFSAREAPLKLAFLTVLGLLLRYLWYDAQPLWTDEAITWEFAKADWSGLIFRQLYDASPPGSYLLLKAWLAVVRSNAEIRLLPALLGAATVPVAYLFGARLHGRAAGLWAALLVALNPLHLYYSNEARYPVLLTLLLALQVLALIEVARRRTWPWFALWSLATAAALWVQYFAGFFLAVEVVYALVVWRRERRMLFRLAVSAVAALLLFAPWWTQFALQMTRGKPSRQFFGLLEELFLAPAFVVLGGSEWSLPTLFGVAPEAAGYVPLALCLMAPFVLAVAMGLRRDRETQPARLCTWLLLGPTLLLIVAGQVLPLFRPKYLLPVLPVAAVLAGAGLVHVAARQRVTGWLLAAAVSAVTVYGTAQLQSDPRLRKEPWDEVAHVIETHARSGDAIAVPNDYYAIALRFVLDDRWPILALVNRGPHEHVTTDRELEDNIRRLFAAHERVWYVDHDAHLFDPAGLAPGAFARIGRDITRLNFPRSRHFSLRWYARDEAVARRSLAGEINWQTFDFAFAQQPADVLPGPAGYVWMGQEVKALVGRAFGEDMAYACFYVHRPFFGGDDPTFSLLVEDEPVRTRRVTQSDLVCLEGLVPAALAERDALTIGLRTDRVFVPAEVLHDGDRTPKSALLQRLGVTRASEHWELP